MFRQSVETLSALFQKVKADERSAETSSVIP